MLKSRQQLEQEEEKFLAPYAVKSAATQGRKYPEPEDNFRTCFQRDRDRIIHCKAFRRLKGKTQVFIAHYGDHYRTRLSHSLEVSQISRDIARTLGLNEDLAESIALAHDLGHTPFGHMGEEALDECLKPYGFSFEHNEQSKRIVEKLEHIYPNFPGLNLSSEVLEGLMKHQTAWDHPKLRETTQFQRASLEAQVVNLADEIAYHNHDIDDGLRSKILSWKEMKKLKIFERAFKMIEKQYGLIEDKKILRARIVSKIISLMINDLYETTREQLFSYDIKSLRDVYHSKVQLVAFSKKMLDEITELKKHLTDKLYFSEAVSKAAKEGKEIIQGLFREYRDNTRLLPRKLQIRDYIAGMTDGFARKEYLKLCYSTRENF